MATGKMKVGGFANFLNVVKPFSNGFTFSVHGDDKKSTIRLSRDDEFITAVFDEPFSEEMKDSLEFLYTLEK